MQTLDAAQDLAKLSSQLSTKGRRILLDSPLSDCAIRPSVTATPISIAGLSAQLCGLLVLTND